MCIFIWECEIWTQWTDFNKSKILNFSIFSQNFLKIFFDLALMRNSLKWGWTDYRPPKINYFVLWIIPTFFNPPKFWGYPQNLDVPIISVLFIYPQNLDVHDFISYFFANCSGAFFRQSVTYSTAIRSIFLRAISQFLLWWFFRTALRASQNLWVQRPLVTKGLGPSQVQVEVRSFA